MRELIPRGDVARGVDARVGALQPIAHQHPGFVIPHPGRVQVQPAGVGRTAHPDQHRIARQVAQPVLLLDHHLRTITNLDPGDLRVQHQLHPLPHQRLLDELRRIRILADKDMGGRIDQRHLRPEPSKRLRHLAPDRPGADHHESLRHLGQLKQRLIREKSRLLQTRDRRHHRAPPGGDDGPRKDQPLAADLYRILGHEPRLPEEHIHPGTCQPLHGIDRADANPQPPHPLHHRGKVHGRARGDTHPERARVLYGRRHPGGADDPLRRHAAGNETVPTDHVPLDQRDPPPDGSAASGGGQPGGAGADDHEVVAARRRWVRPSRRVRMLCQQPVVRVIRRDARGRLVHGLDLRRGLGHRVDEATFDFFIFDVTTMRPIIRRMAIPSFQMCLGSVIE